MGLVRLPVTCRLQVVKFGGVKSCMQISDCKGVSTPNHGLYVQFYLLQAFHCISDERTFLSIGHGRASVTMLSEPPSQGLRSGCLRCCICIGHKLLVTLLLAQIPHFGNQPIQA